MDDLGEHSVLSLWKQLGDRSATVVKGLLNLLQDPEFEVRYRAAAVFGELGKSDPEIESLLVGWIEKHFDSHNLGSAIDALWQICA